MGQHHFHLGERRQVALFRMTEAVLSEPLQLIWVLVL
ncbi:hypothetical protein LINGRAHAP2_LOCUS28698 [Linum grandiflorum]